MRAAAKLLLDSSVWIDYYRPGGRRDRREAIREALARDRVATTAMIVTEILQGASTAEDYEALREDFAALHWLDITQHTSETAGRFGCDLRRRGEPVPATDLIIAAVALEHGYGLWHLDAHFETIAKVTPFKERRLE